MFRPAGTRGTRGRCKNDLSLGEAIRPALRPPLRGSDRISIATPGSAGAGAGAPSPAEPGATGAGPSGTKIASRTLDHCSRSLLSRSAFASTPRFVCDGPLLIHHGGAKRCLDAEAISAKVCVKCPASAEPIRPRASASPERSLHLRGRLLHFRRHPAPPDARLGSQG